MESRTVTAELPSNKRPRSPSGDFSPNVSKMPKTQSNSLHINYLARQYPDNLPLVSTDDSLPNILRLIGEYDGVLQRHESIAGNLGACPLGPILMKRFERLFEGPPRVLKSNGKEGTNVTWLDVVEFAKNKPEQFNLEKTRNGVRVCQFYTKQCRVEISEEDYVLIASGMPQKLIPPQPIDEDEEKEVGVLEILEKNLQQITAMADSAAARARQLSYRLKSRRNAIVTRRENDRNKYSQSPPLHEHGNTETTVNGTGFANPPSPPGGFVAVNAGRPAETTDEHPLSTQFMLNHPNTDNITIINGTNIKGASPTTRAELLKKFLTTADRAGRGPPENESAASLTRQSSRAGPRRSDATELPPVVFNNSTGTVAIPNTPPSLLPQPKSVNHHERDDGGPYKLEMVARMEDLQRGERILPPCDRCRRLHMDCLKNLTACMGCTKKHAKCSWKDVKEEELRDLQPRSQPRAHVEEQREFARPAAPDNNNHQDEHGTDHTHPLQSNTVYPSHDSHTDPHANPHNALVLVQSEPPSHPYSQHQATAPRRANSEIHNLMLNHDQHPDSHHQHLPHIQQHQPQQPQQPQQHHHHDRRTSFHHRNILHENNANNNLNNHLRNSHHRNNETDNDPDANSRLMQAIKDTVDHHNTRVQVGREKHIRDGE
ncbi:C6 finger domain protein, putative [Talaromyces stipitatus ATCC 10500]|uniref:C6 finger domain protein, putative n=1 Tax=Talaromyces stipitatus (strain ATCC 10500 / CBS 375.48 / QM 6759 / NRRL 1006) TaxID=441959 RepID=B8M1V7_TALSN|nr:C6 finger domain protein, putative [Talaromyces stipitatus ATCC 10500]EED21335.1 C6 finger domain protein, putative [Talaromyces stipitatus ATCC 10500]